MSRLARPLTLRLPPQTLGVWLCSGSLLLIALLYAFLALDLAQFRAFWSPDSGVRFWMIRNWVERGDLIYLPYDAAPMDPTGRLHPLSAGYPGYIAHLKHGLCTIYPPLFPFICGLFYRALGFSGLSIVPVLSGLGATVYITLTARRMGLRCWPMLPLITGLATPVLIYSVIFWDHATYLCVTAAAMYALYDCLERDRLRSAFAAGVLLGLGIWLHEFFFALFGAIVIGALVSPSDTAPRRFLAPLTAGFALMFVGWLVFNSSVYTFPGGPHVLGANNPSQPQFVRRLLALSWMLVQAMGQLSGKGTWRDGILLVMLWFIYCSHSGGPAHRAVPLILLAGALLTGYAGWMETWSNGFFAATPLLIPALAGRWHSRLAPQQPAPIMAEIWFSRAALGFGLVVLLTPIGGGPGWGNRAMLTALPLALIVAARVIERELEATGSVVSRRLTVTAAAALVAVSFCSQVRGWLLIREQLAANAEQLKQVRNVTTPLIATDNWLLWPFWSASPQPGLQGRFIVRNRPGDRVLFKTLLTGDSGGQFTYLASAAAAEHLKRTLNSTGRSFRMEQPQGNQPENAWLFTALPSAPGLSQRRVTAIRSQGGQRLGKPQAYPDERG